MSLKRRDFLKGLGATLALSALPNTRSFAYQPKELQNNDEILVFVFLRGGCDSLNFIAPVGDRFYNDARPKDLRVSDKSRFNLKNGLDGLDFNIHPKAAALKELYDNDNLAIIHAAGLTNGTRSHFEAMDLIERGLLQSQGSAKGWMTRYLDTIENRDEMYSVAVGCNGLPDLFFGSNKAIGIDALSDFDIEGEPIVKEILRDFYSGNNLLDKTAQNALNTIDFLKQKLKKNPAFAKDHYHAEHGAKYPDQWHVEDFSNSLQSLAKLIKMDTGVHLAAVEYDNWDHHQNQAYKFPNQIEGLSDSLAAFYNDLSNYHNNLTVVVMSEFGRRLKSNRSGGTDHGYGGATLVLGGNIKGGKMYGSWPGLANKELNNAVDLDITTDYRSILGEILSERMGAKKLDFIFPEFQLGQKLGFC